MLLCHLSFLNQLAVYSFQSGHSDLSFVNYQDHLTSTLLHHLSRLQRLFSVQTQLDQASSFSKIGIDPWESAQSNSRDLVSSNFRTEYSLIIIIQLSLSFLWKLPLQSQCNYYWLDWTGTSKSHYLRFLKPIHEL